MPVDSSQHPRRIAIIGGTFDPPHRGHLAAAQAVRDQLAVDQIWFMVAGNPYQKTDSRPITDGAVRVAMVRALVNAEPGFSVDDREVRRIGPTYTVDTLEELVREMPDTSFYLVIGADAAAGFSTWKSPERIVALSTLVIVNRTGAQQSQQWRGSLPPDASVVEVMMSPVDVSSTDIRARVADGSSAESLAEMMTPAVARIIVERGLYQERR